ncbi:MAG: hypothetical protein DDT31_01260 [Syntrophomonadaceae bacterium]|nr:hypothetical protein [Bacillota bacterium]
MVKFRRTVQPRPREGYLSETALSNFTSIMLREIKSQTKDLNYVPRKYTREQISKFMENPVINESQLREISHHLFVASGAYRRLIWYWSSMLTLDSVLVPDRERITQVGFKRQLDRATRYLDNYNIKYEFGKALSYAMLDGVYFGLERVEKDQIMLQRLPTDICRITHLINGVYGFSIDMAFFDKHENRQRLDTEFPPEILEMYRAYEASKHRAGARWQLVDESIGVCYKVDHAMLANIPPLAGTFIDLIYLDGAKAISYAENLLANFRLLVAQIPWKKDAQSEDDMLMTWATSQKFWSILQKTVPEYVGVAVTPFDKLEFASIDGPGDKRADKIERAENNVYVGAGVSAGLFNSQNDNSISLNRGIEVDEGTMWIFLRYLERLFRNRFISMNLPFKIIFPDISIYNRKEMAREYRTDAQGGLPKSFLAAARGYSASDMMNLLAFENDYLGLTDKTVPLKSSHTSVEDVGRPPTEDINDLGGAGVKARDGDTNRGRAK